MSDQHTPESLLMPHHANGHSATDAAYADRRTRQ